MMRIFPAVDILGGRCVQLVQGKRESATAYGDPLSCARRWLGTGVTRIILSTLAIQKPECIRTLSQEYGSDRVMAGVDAKGGMVAIHGWQETAGDYIGWAKTFESLGAGSLLYTNVDVEGLQKGIAAGPVRQLIGSVHIPVVVAGGVSGRADVAALRDAGAYGAVLGSALYSGKINLSEALEESR